MLLADKTNLRSRDQRSKKVESMAVVGMAKDGVIRGRDKDGNPIVGKVTGQSLAGRLKAEADERRMNEKEHQKGRRRRR